MMNMDGEIWKKRSNEMFAIQTAIRRMMAKKWSGAVIALCNCSDE